MRVYHALLWLACASAFALPATPTVESRLRQAVIDTFGTPRRLYTVIPLELPPDEERKTLFAMDVLFRPAKIEALELRNVTERGHVGSLTVRVRDINVFGLKVDYLELVAEDFDIDLPRLNMKGEVGLAGDARVKMTGRVLEADLNRVSPNYKLELKPDDFAVSGRAGVLFIRAGYRMHGTIVATPDNQLVFTPRSLSYGFLPIPKALYAAQVRRVNPIFDMARFLGQTRGGFDLHFQKAALEKEQATIALAGTIHAHPAVVPPLAPLVR